MAGTHSDTITDPDNLLPNYYTALGVPYNANQETIEAAFVSLIDDSHAFSMYKRIICDAFTCLASSGDRAAYDAFYFHTPCWYSKALWLSYRDERRRLTWDDTAAINTRHLGALQQAVRTAAADTTPAGRGRAAAASPLGPAPSACAQQKPRTRRRRKARKKEHGGNEAQAQEQALATKRDPDHPAHDGGSDSAKSDNTWTSAGQARLAAGAVSAASATSRPNSTAAAAGATPVAQGAKADLAVPERPADDMGVLPSQAVGIAPPLSTVPHNPLAAKVRRRVAATRGPTMLRPRSFCTDAKKKEAGSVLHGAVNGTRARVGVGAGASHRRASVPSPVSSTTVPTRPGNRPTARPATSASRSGHVPALASTPTAATAQNATKTAPRAARATASTATAMTASAMSRVRAARGPVPVTGKQPASSRAAGASASASAGLAAPTAQPGTGSSRAHGSKTTKTTTTTTTTTTTAPPIRGRRSTPTKTAPSAQVTTQAAGAGPAAHTSADTVPSVASADAGVGTATTDTVATISATTPDKTPPLKHGLASSRWADPQTCANGQRRHPLTLNNWQRLLRPGKCTACGSASSFQPKAKIAADKVSSPSSPSHLYWCRMCSAPICNECYISKIIHRQWK